LESESFLRDEPNEPLGFRPNARELATRRGTGAFAAGAAFVAVAVLSSQIAYLVASSPQGRMLVATGGEAIRAPAAGIVPLRGIGATGAVSERSHVQIAADHGAADDSAIHAARSGDARRPSGARSLIIDVRQALTRRRGSTEEQPQP
jgi:hypothetical protein